MADDSKSYVDIVDINHSKVDILKIQLGEFMQTDIIIDGFSSKKTYEYENAFHWFSSSIRIAKMIAQYEIYKLAVNIPGSVAEFGVFKGNSLIRLATFREMLESNKARKIYAFDTYGAFPKTDISKECDKNFITNFTTATPPPPELETLLTIFKNKGFENIDFIKGDVRQTLPALLQERQELKFSLVHLDMDVYEPTSHILKEIHPRMVKNGIIMIDDYNLVGGATMAIDEFLTKCPNLNISKLAFSHTPSFIIMK